MVSAMAHSDLTEDRFRIEFKFCTGFKEFRPVLNPILSVRPPDFLIHLTALPIWYIKCKS